MPQTQVEYPELSPREFVRAILRQFFIMGLRRFSSCGHHAASIDCCFIRKINPSFRRLHKKAMSRGNRAWAEVLYKIWSAMRTDPITGKAVAFWQIVQESLGGWVEYYDCDKEFRIITNVEFTKCELESLPPVWRKIVRVYAKRLFDAIVSH